jgi:polyphosphate kinase 2 (PPK2 family)
MGKRSNTTSEREVNEATSAVSAADAVEDFTVIQQIHATQDARSAAADDILDHLQEPPSGYTDALKAVEAILQGASPDDAAALKQALLRWPHTDQRTVSRDEELVKDPHEAVYPYKHRLTRKTYERRKYKLQVELLKLQAWVKESGQRVVILFEGRDAAGKGGAIKRFMEHLNPRGARVVALEKPTELERGQWYFQRYLQHMLTAGEIVLFDRSWYNSAGVERVMGFCTDQEYQMFMRRQAPEIERHLSASGIHLFKFWVLLTFRQSRSIAVCNVLTYRRIRCGLGMPTTSPTPELSADVPCLNRF